MVTDSVCILRWFNDLRIRKGAILERAIDFILEKQRSDGSWSSEDGEKYSASATIKALGVLKEYNLI